MSENKDINAGNISQGNKSAATNNFKDTAVVSEADVTAMIYNELNKIFGSGNQLFCMEMPGRILNQLDYAYPMEDYNSSSLTKPYVIQENEFRLTDKERV